MNTPMSDHDVSALLQVIADTAPVVGFRWNLVDNQVTWSATEAECEAWGLQPDADGHSLLADVHPEDVLQIRRSLREHLRGESSQCDLSHRRQHPTLGWRRVRGQARATRSADGEPVCMYGAFYDVHHEQDHLDQMARSARRDGLTGLPNRVALVERLERALEQRAALGLPAGLLLVDLDRFRSINRALGPQAGDAMLCHVAELLRSQSPSGSFLARVGADQFAILVGLESGVASDAAGFADQLLEALAQPLFLEGHEVSTAASIGVLTIDGRWTDAQTAFRDAENALACAKDAGGNRWSPFVADQAAETERISLEARLRHAVEEGNLRLWYQAIVALPTRDIVAFEGLLRWQDPELGWVSPGRFVPVAEETGLIIPIGTWVLEEACRTLHAWRQQPGGDHLRMNVNLSAVQFRQDNLPEIVDGILDRYPLARGHLNLELTETALMERPGDQVAVLERLRGLGCQLHIDDFGTGWSSLSNLVKLPVDALKVDREFVMRAEEDRKSLAVVRTVARMAQEMGLSLTAEGVETNGQLQILNALGRCRGQGYLFSKPLPADQALDRLLDPNTLLLEPTLYREAG